MFFYDVNTISRELLENRLLFAFMLKATTALFSRLHNKNVSSFNTLKIIKKISTAVDEAVTVLIN